VKVVLDDAPAYSTIWMTLRLDGSIAVAAAIA
jgi:hypothetical protein